MRHLLGAAGLVASLGAVSCNHAQAAPERSPVGGTFVVVELFSSEGCSSCPPADAVLRKLDAEHLVGDATIIALEFHVDYWDRLGWKDPFSQSAWTERQRDYARFFGKTGVYTPQAIVDGRDELNGASEAQVRRSIAAAALRSHVAVELVRETEELNVRVRNAPSSKLVLWFAVTERGLSTAVPRGENGGATLAHGPVVRALTKVASFAGPQFEARVPIPHGAWRDERATYVAFVQEEATGALLGANVR